MPSSRSSTTTPQDDAREIIRRASDRYSGCAATKESRRRVLLDRKLEYLKIHRDRLLDLEAQAIARLRAADLRRPLPILVAARKEDGALWTWYRAVLSSAPARGRIGRRRLLFVVDRRTNGILGIVEINSDLIFLPPRDRALGIKGDISRSAIGRNIAGVGTCVMSQPFGTLCGGKFAIEAVVSREIGTMYRRAYGDELLHLTTTSLFGKSSIYNRCPSWEYLGESQGLVEGNIFTQDEKRDLIRCAFQMGTAGRSRSPTSHFEILIRLVNRLKIPPESLPRFAKGVYLARHSDAFNRPMEDIATWYINRWHASRFAKFPETAAFDFSAYKIRRQIETCEDATMTRVGGADGGAPVEPAGGDGSNPLPTLQNVETTT